jgi:hypothetical protein
MLTDNGHKVNILANVMDTPATWNTMKGLKGIQCTFILKTKVGIRVEKSNEIEEDHDEKSFSRTKETYYDIMELSKVLSIFYAIVGRL